MKNIIITIIAVIITINTFADTKVTYLHSDSGLTYQTHSEKEIDELTTKGEKVVFEEEPFKEVFFIGHTFSWVKLGTGANKCEEIKVHTFSFEQAWTKILSKENSKSNNVILWSVDRTGVPQFQKKPGLSVHHRYVYIDWSLFSENFTVYYGYECGQWVQTAQVY